MAFDWVEHDQSAELQIIECSGQQNFGRQKPTARYFWISEMQRVGDGIADIRQYDVTKLCGQIYAD